MPSFSLAPLLVLAPATAARLQLFHDRALGDGHHPGRPPPLPRARAGAPRRPPARSDPHEPAGACPSSRQSIGPQEQSFAGRVVYSVTLDVPARG
jgi:hypothetical protein